MKKPCEMIHSLESTGVKRVEIARMMHVNPGTVTRYSTNEIQPSWENYYYLQKFYENKFANLRIRK